MMIPDDMPRDLADALGQLASQVASPRRTVVAPTPPAVEMIREDGFWAVFLHGKEVGWIDRCAFNGGFRAVVKDDGEVHHTMSLSVAKDFRISRAI